MSSTMYVSVTGGGGDYVCTDGATNCQTVINKALAWANNDSESRTVYLKGPHTYYISGGLKGGSNTHLIGDSTVVVKVATSAPNFKGYNGFITLLSPSVHDLEISGFELDGSCGARPASYEGNHHDSERAICLIGPSTKTLTNVSIHDMYIHDSFSDGIHVHWGTSGIKLYNNIIKNCQHDGIFCVELTGSDNEIYKNTIEGICDGEMRLDNCQNVKIHDNILSPYLDSANLNGQTRQGDNGIQISSEGVSDSGGTNYPDATSNIEVYNNTFTNQGISGILLWDTRGKGANLTQTVKIHHNTFNGCSVKYSWAAWHGSVCFYKWGNGVSIQYNTFDGCYDRVVNIVNPSGTSAYTVDISNNNIINSKGYGIYRNNNSKSYVSPSISNNYFSGNTANIYPSSLTHKDASALISTAGAGNYDSGSGTGSSSETTTTSDDTSTGGSTSGGTTGGTTGGSTTIIGGQSKTNLITPYISSSSALPTPWVFNYYEDNRTAYVNGIPIYHHGFEHKVSQSLSDEHPPGTDYDNIGDFGEQSAQITVHCHELSLANARKAVAAWKSRTPTIFEPGGPYEGWFLQGKLSSRESEVQFTSDENWYSKIAYDIDFLCDNAVYYSTIQHVRARKVYEDEQIWNSDDCYAGNIATNGSFDHWTPNYEYNWVLRNSAADNNWEEIRYSSDLGKFCAVASSGTDNRVMVGDGYTSWRLPTGLTCANKNNAWKTVVWCAEWGIWFAFSSSGLSGYACMSSVDTDTWIAVPTPSAADFNGWSCSVWIPPATEPDMLITSEGDSLVTSDGDTLFTTGDSGFYLGRVLVFASSGTNRIMYSDDQGVTFTLKESPDESASWVSADFSASLERILVVASTGQLIYSDDYGDTFTLVDGAPSQNWTSVKWIESDNLWAVCSLNGAQQIMTSPTGIDNWTLQDTPYSTTTRTDPGTVVSTKTNTTKTGVMYSSAATAYKADTTSLEYTIELPALTNGHVYRINTVSGYLKTAISGRRVYMKITIQYGSGTETTLKEWNTIKPSYIKEYYDVAQNSSTNQTVTIRYYLRTSCAKCRSEATLFSVSYSEMTLAGSSITYNRNQWQALADSPDHDVVVCVANTGAGNRVIKTTDCIGWENDDSVGDYNWSDVCYAKGLDTFVAVAKSGSGVRIMSLTIPDPYQDIAPDGWDLVSKGQIRYSTIDETDYMYQINGDGVTADRGCITQELQAEPGIDYILSAVGFAEGVTQGTLVVEVIADGTTMRKLVWDSEDTEQIPLSGYVYFDTTPESVILKVHGTGTINNGGIFRCNVVRFESYADFDIDASGSSILTSGSMYSTPDVKISSNSMTTSTTSTGQQLIQNYGKDTVLSSTSKIYSKKYEVVLDSLGSGKQYRLDEVFSNLGIMKAGSTARMKVTVQSSGTSLYDGAETTIAEWDESVKVPPNYSSHKKDLALLADESESLVLRYYLKSNNHNYAAKADSFGYKYSVVTTTVVSGGVSIINTADPLTVMTLCNNLYPGCSLKYNNDMTGEFIYSEDYRDDTWRTVCQSWTGDVTYSQTDRTVTLASGSNMLYLFDVYAPITGIPYINIKVRSGIPQFSISVDNTNWYSIDGNTANSLTNTKISRQLDSNDNSFHLKGNTFFYLKVEPPSGSSCVLGATFLHADLNTMDIPRIKLYPTGLPQSIEAFMDAPTNAIITLYSRDVHPAV